MVVDFAPQLELLDKAAMLITHAGVNTVLEALCRGVPMVALPRNADQPGNAARIEYAGGPALDVPSRHAERPAKLGPPRADGGNIPAARCGNWGRPSWLPGGAARAARS